MSIIKIMPVKGHEVFSKIFSEGKKFGNAQLLSVFIFSNSDLKIRQKDKNDVFYFGVTCPKKKAKKAVVRNRIKRLLRVSINKICKDRFADQNQFCFKYAVFIWNEAPKHPMLIGLEDVMPKVEKVFDSAEIYFQKHIKNIEANNSDSD
jgi:ribonuclease P protein component